MKNLEISFFNFIKIFLFINTLFYSINAQSNEIDFINIIEKNWNETKTLTGQFNQIIGKNKIVSGNFYIEKPYKSNFSYNNELENIITSKFFINIIDKEGSLIDRYPIINQPIYKLLSEKIDLEKTFEVMSINNKSDEIILTLLPKDNSHNSEARINIAFDNLNYSLKNWEIIDEIGQSTYLEFTKIRKNISIDPKLFIYKEVNN